MVCGLDSWCTSLRCTCHRYKISYYRSKPWRTVNAAQSLKSLVLLSLWGRLSPPHIDPPSWSRWLLSDVVSHVCLWFCQETYVIHGSNRGPWMRMVRGPDHHCACWHPDKGWQTSSACWAAKETPVGDVLLYHPSTHLACRFSTAAGLQPAVPTTGSAHLLAGPQDSCLWQEIWFCSA